MSQTTKIEDRVKATMEEVSAILSERRSEDDRGTEDAGVGEMPWKGAKDALVGSGAGTEQTGTVHPPKVDGMKAEGVEDDKGDEQKEAADGDDKDDEKAEDAYESAMSEISNIIGERRSSDVRAAEDEPIGNAPGVAKAQGATMGYIPWKVGESVAVTVPATATTTESLVRASIHGEEKDGKVAVRIESEQHMLKGRVMEWPTALVKRLS